MPTQLPEKEVYRGFDFSRLRKIEVIRNARHENVSIELISRIVNLPPERVRQILYQLGIE